MIQTTAATAFVWRKLIEFCLDLDLNVNGMPIVAHNSYIYEIQLYEIFKQIDMSKETFLFTGFTRLKQLEYLLCTQQIDHNFFWN